MECLKHELNLDDRNHDCVY